MGDNSISNQDASIRFMENDFNQSYLQMRHYDTQIYNAFRFLFTLYVGLIGASLSLFQIGIQKGINLVMPGVAILVVGLVIGIFMLAIIVRTRAYFVHIARYINEQRHLYLRNQPMGFNNKSRMYTDSMKPLYFDWRSSQFGYIIIISLFNSVLVGVLFYIIAVGLGYIVVATSIVLVVEILVARGYLISKDKQYRD